jgi:hypothetical protein
MAEAEKIAKQDGQVASSDSESALPSPARVVNERALLRKVDLRLLPPLTLLYLLSFLDRSNVGNARIEGLTEDLNMTGDQYLTGLTLYFIGYVLFEVPCNIVLKIWTPRAWLPTLALAWGIVSTLMGVTQSLAGFFVVRFFLGVTESGLFPGIVFYFSMWYVNFGPTCSWNHYSFLRIKSLDSILNMSEIVTSCPVPLHRSKSRKESLKTLHLKLAFVPFDFKEILLTSSRYKRNERVFRIALFFSAASLAGAFGGILAWGIAHMRGVGGYNGWRWIFILVYIEHLNYSPCSNFQ